MLNGIIIINKPKDYTSHDVVARVKKILNEKVGHTGTLDPNATGVLPLLIGQGTKLSAYLINHDKEYVVTMKLGQKTNTADIEGSIIEEKEVKKELITEENVKKILDSFVGKQKQIPPMYSAIKLNGKKLYEYARENKQVELKPRQIEIYSIKLIKIDILNKQIDFKVSCSKGTYIRSLCEDIAEKLQTVAFMKDLQRTKVGEFKIEDSITLEELEKFHNSAKFMNEHFISIEKFFENKEKNDIYLSEEKIKKFLNGVKITYELKDGMYRIYSKDKAFIGIGLVKNNLLKRQIVVENKC